MHCIPTTNGKLFLLCFGMLLHAVCNILIILTFGCTWVDGKSDVLIDNEVLGAVNPPKV